MIFRSKLRTDEELESKKEGGGRKIAIVDSDVRSSIDKIVSSANETKGSVSAGKSQRAMAVLLERTVRRAR